MRYFIKLILIAGGCLILNIACVKVVSDTSKVKGIVWVAKPDTEACLDVTASSSCFKVEWGRPLLVTNDKLEKLAPASEWIKVLTTEDAEQAWFISRKNIVSLEDFKPIDKALPIKHISYEDGEAWEEFEFSDDGKIYTVVKGGNKVEVQAFFAPDIIDLRYPHPDFGTVSNFLGFKNGKIHFLNCSAREVCEVKYK